MFGVAAANFSSDNPKTELTVSVTKPVDTLIKSPTAPYICSEMFQSFDIARKLYWIPDDSPKSESA